jgi:hypothetical protein
MKKQSIIVLDFIGISSASICLVHCLIFPLLSIIPLGFSDNYWIDILFTCVGMFVVSKIAMNKAPKIVKIILINSILLLMIGVVLETIWQINTPLVLIGGIGMILGHILNYKMHSK